MQLDRPGPIVFFDIDDEFSVVLDDGQVLSDLVALNHPDPAVRTAAELAHRLNQIEDLPHLEASNRPVLTLVGCGQGIGCTHPDHN